MGECRDCAAKVCSVHVRQDGWNADEPFDTGLLRPFGAWNKPISVDVTVANVDSEVMALLTGVRPNGEKPATQSMEIWGEHKWRWWQWQWWLRRPKRKYHYVIPNARIKID